MPTDKARSAYVVDVDEETGKMVRGTRPSAKRVRKSVSVDDVRNEAPGKNASSSVDDTKVKLCKALVCETYGPVPR